MSENCCPFCNFEEIKDRIIWENDNFVAFLSKYPNTKGFTVIATKIHYESDITQLPTKIYSGFFLSAKKVSEILKRYFDDVGRVSIVYEGMGVNHAHIKLIPMHGTKFLEKGGWEKLLTNEKIFFPKYGGYISTMEGLLYDSDKLNKLANNIKKIEEDIYGSKRKKL